MRQILVFIMLTLSFCIRNECRAQSSLIRDSIAVHFEHMVYPGLVIGRSFNSGDFKLGVNLADYIFVDIDHYKGEWTGYEIERKFRKSRNSCLIPMISLNQHFIRDKAYRNTISQSLEFFSFIPHSLDGVVPLLALGIQVQHYNFKTMCVSPQIKLLPPFLNFYIKGNYLSGEITPIKIPKYEVGIELNLNLVVGICDAFDVLE